MRGDIIMIGKQIWINKLLSDDIAFVLKEVMNYIEIQQKGEMIQTGQYADVLLFISELLPHIKDKNMWVDLGYRLCRRIKQNLESHGYNSRISMIGGLGYECFAINAFCQEANILQNFSSSYNSLLFCATDIRLKQINNYPTCDSNYDMISGISGLLYYLLDHNNTQEENKILTKCIQYLVSFTQDKEFQGKAIIGFHVLQPNQNPNFDQRDFRHGSINFGLAHGMLGPLIALSKAYAEGFYVNGLKEGIEKIYHLYEIYRFVNETNISYWPGQITVDEYWERECRVEHLHSPCSWCYGNIGIIRGLQKVAGYMGWSEKEQTHIEEMKLFLTKDKKTYNLISPSLCHGFSSIVAIQTCAYSTYRDLQLLANLERNVKEIIKGYRRNNEREVSLADICNETIWLEGYLKDLSLLTGSIGIATTLLSLRGSMKVGKLLMID